jgi:hypothetical protein
VALKLIQKFKEFRINKTTLKNRKYYLTSGLPVIKTVVWGGDYGQSLLYAGMKKHNETH